MTTSGTNVVQALQQEKKIIAQKIELCRREATQLASRLRVVDRTIGELAPNPASRTNGVSHVSKAKKAQPHRAVARSQFARPSPQSHRSAKSSVAAGRQLNLRGLKSYKKSSPTRVRSARSRHDVSSMEMARQVLRNAGQPLSADEILEGIRNTYRVQPALSTKQMLYKRAHAGTGFRRTKEGKYALDQHQQQVEQPTAMAA